MITPRELMSGIFGAWRLAHGDRAGLGWLDGSARGAQKSFWAAALAFPAYCALVGLEFIHQPVDASAGRILVVYAIAYGFDWAAFPLAMAFIATMMDKDDQYCRYVTALNWARCIEIAVFLPAALIAVIAPDGILGILPVIVLMAVLVYHWFVARVALDIGAYEAGFVVVVNMVLSLVISGWARSLVS